MYSDPEQRENEIKNLSVELKSIADEILPQLRRSRLKLTVDVTGKSDIEEIAKLANEDVSKLSVEELLWQLHSLKMLTKKLISIRKQLLHSQPTCARSTI